MKKDTKNLILATTVTASVIGLYVSDSGSYFWVAKNNATLISLVKSNNEVLL